MDATDAAGADHDASEHTSRWPIVAALGAAALYVGAGGAMAVGDALPRTPLLLVAGVGLVVVVGGLAGWAREAFFATAASDHPGEAGSRSGLYVGGMWLFLLSDLATFAAGFVYYAFVRSGTWPPSELPPLLGSLVLVNTVVLVASSVTVHIAHGALEAGDRRRFLGLLGGTVLLGAVFLAGQVYEYYEFVTAEAFTLSDGVFASAFYGLTGLQGLHVTLGVVMLAVLFGRAFRGGYAAGDDTSVRTVSLY